MNMNNANNMDVVEHVQQEVVLPDRAPALWLGMNHNPPPPNVKRASVIAQRINTLMASPHLHLINDEDINFLNAELEIFQLLPQDTHYMVPEELDQAEGIIAVAEAQVHGGRRSRRGRSRRTRRRRTRRSRSRRTRHRK